MSFDKGPRDDRWYFYIMAPNTKGDKFAWLDPTSIYINGRAIMICWMIFAKR
jgi:adenine phosphoribosyltransferase